MLSPLQIRGAVLAATLALLAATCLAQTPTSAPVSGSSTVAAAPASFVIHGVVKSGGTPLPGVSVTAAHSLTGRKVLSSTDLNGNFRLELPGRGRWVLRVELTAFAVQTAEVTLLPAQPDATQNFELMLISRAPKAAAAEGEAQVAGVAAPRQPSVARTGNSRGAQRLTVNGDDAALALSANASDVDLSGGSGLANSADATNDSVAVSGRMGSAQDLGAANTDELRDRIEEMRSRGQFGGGGGDFGGGGPGGAGGGGFGGMRLRAGSLNRLHGTFYEQGSNAVLDASPYSLSGPSEKPAYGSNRFGGSLGGTLKIPHLYDDGGKTFFFLNYSGIRSTTPYDVFSHVPSLAERGGDFTQSTLSDGTPVTLYDPSNPGNLLGDGHHVTAISGQALALLNYIPVPNVFNDPKKNYHFSSAAESDQDIFSLRLTHNFGAVPQRGQQGGAGRGGGNGSGRPRNNLNFGINYQRNQSQSLTPFPSAAGITHTNGYNANLGWAVGKGKLSNQLRFTWNRGRAHSDGLYGYNARGVNPAGVAGIGYPGGQMSDTANYGLPTLNFTDYANLTDTAPSSRDSQTFTLSENFGWVRGKHHMHYGGDFRWINNRYYASTNPRGGFTFTGSSTADYVGGAAVPGTGYDLADFLLGRAQSTALAYSSVHDRFLGTSYDLFAMDDFRAKSNLTLNYGVRYEFVSPFDELHNQLANLDAGFNGKQFLGAQPVAPGATGPYHGEYPRALVRADHLNFAPRIGLAWKPKGNKTVVRAGYGINYNLGQYGSIVQNLAAQPNFSFTQTNAAPATGPSPYTMADGFPTTTATSNNYGVDPNYRVAYVQMWNLNVQREITSTVLLNVGYTGSKGTALDMLRAPNRGPDGILIPGIESFTWETSQGSSILHAGSVRLRKRMARGFSAGGTYTYSKSIDNAGSIGGGTQVVAQDDTNLRAERGLSSFDQRHKLSADGMLELPWGEGRRWMTRPGVARTAFGDWMVQTTITVASGTPYTARVVGSYSDVAGGVNGSLRANYNGEGIQLGDRSWQHYFNTAAFTAPASGTYGNAGRNTIIGPGSWVANFVLSKNFPIRDGQSVEVRAEADNVFNHPNAAGIDTNLTSATYGQVTSVGSMRKMVLSARYRF